MSQFKCIDRPKKMGVSTLGIATGVLTKKFKTTSGNSKDKHSFFVSGVENFARNLKHKTLSEPVLVKPYVLSWKLMKVNFYKL